MRKQITLLLQALLCACLAKAQTDTFIYVSVISDTVVSSIGQDSIYVVPQFTDTNITNIANRYHFTLFQPAFRNSRFPDMHNVYKMSCDNNAGIVNELSTAYPNVVFFSDFEVPHITAARDTPNDWLLPGRHWTVWPWAHDYIRAPEAWVLAKGDPSTIIGITDTYFDLDNPDLISKVAYVDVNSLPATDTNHGTMAAGLAAGHANNGIGYPSIGYNCMLRLSNNWADHDQMYEMSRPHAAKAKVINASWFTRVRDDNTYEQDNVLGRRIYNEIYENGVTVCMGAGNGTGHSIVSSPSQFCFPPSFDHVISTTSVLGMDCPWVTTHPITSYYNCGRHMVDANPENTHQHNTAVDIAAPGRQIGAQSFDWYTPPGTDSQRWFCHSCGNGTSYGSPMTAGVFGLMASEVPCLSPYQLEHALKMGSDPSIYTHPDNAYVASPKRIGWGGLNAYGAVFEAKRDGACNNPATQTFQILGVEINTLCRPGYSSNGVKPQLTPILKNGIPPYRYVWTRMPFINTQLDDYTSPQPTIIAASTGPFPDSVSLYLTVYDGSPITKVAHRLVKFKMRTSNDYELASRDSYVDMMDEPNCQTFVDPHEIWYLHSPDIWNRHNNDWIPVPENPEYFSGGAPNYLTARIRNIGCAAYNDADEAVVHLYWTLASTGEEWAHDWISSHVPAAGGGTVPGGGSITGASPIAIPDLEPGSSYLARQAWYPPNPTTFEGSPTDVVLCFLSRLIEPAKINYGITFTEMSISGFNIARNNNIVSRNTHLVNLGRKQAKKQTVRIYVNNADNTTRLFSLDMFTDRDVHLHFAGNTSEYAYVGLKMQSGLFSRWAAGGYKGSYASYDINTETVYYDPATPLRLDSIALDTAEKYYVDIGFTLRDDVPIRPFAPQQFHFRQLIDTPTADSVYGMVSFELSITEDDTIVRRGVLVVTEVADGPRDNPGCQYAELLVANCGANMADSVDIRGWIVNDNSGLLYGGCDPDGVTRGHLRFAHNDYWAKVPVGSILVMYNGHNNCYSLPDTLTYNADSGVYWIPIDSSGASLIEQYTGVENNYVCSYCSDTGATIYTPAQDWMDMNALATHFDGIETVCPGCTVEIPTVPSFYNGLAYAPAQGNMFLLGTDTSLGLIIVENNDLDGGYKYVFTGNTGEELTDYTKWEFRRSDTAGIKPPTLGNVTAPFRELVMTHDLDLPCCGVKDTASASDTSQARPANNNDKRAAASYATALKVYPNPASNIVHFEFPYAKNINITITDVAGREVGRQALKNTGRAAFDVRQYAPGLYFYRARMNGQEYNGKMTIQH